MDGHGQTARRSTTLGHNQGGTVNFAVTVGPNARYTQPYWKVHPGVDRYDIEVPEHQTLQWSPPDVTATVNYTAAGVNASLDAVRVLPLRRAVGRLGEAEDRERRAVRRGEADARTSRSCRSWRAASGASSA